MFQNRNKTFLYFDLPLLGSLVIVGLHSPDVNLFEPEEGHQKHRQEVRPNGRTKH